MAGVPRTSRRKRSPLAAGSSATGSKTAERGGPGRPPVISNERLLEVAREVFLERGVRATTAEVAERAGVSEGTVFHRFRSKDALFHQAMHFDIDELPQLMASALEGLEELEIREAMVLAATRLLDVARVALPLVMMTWSNPVHCGVPDERKRHAFRDVLKQFAAFFERKMNQGKLRRMDAEIFARAFIGTIHHYGMSELTRQNTEEFALPEGMYVRGIVDLLLTGAAPRQEIPTPAGSARRLVRG